MKKTYYIMIIFLLLSCTNNKRNKQNEYCYTNKFTFIDKKNNFDTINFYGYINLDSAISCAKKTKRNILTIFSGWACMSVRGLEWKQLNMFGDNDFIQSKFVIAWLPVDDKTPLLDTTKFDTIENIKIHLRTIGDKNASYQIKLTKTNSEPIFCFLDSNKIRYGEIIHNTNNKKLVQEWIKSGLKVD